MSKKYGYSNHPLRGVHSSMKARCYNVNCDAYKYYGGRGVIVCDEWHDFKSFYDWAIANGWKQGLDIDKDIKAKELGVEPLLYSPERCQFVTRKENCDARISNRLITFNGETKTINQWAEIIGIKRETIAKRLDLLGWSTEKAFSKKDHRTLVKKRNFKKSRKGANSPMAKKIKQINKTTNEAISIFDALVIAEEKTGVRACAISSALKGRYKTGGGYKWEYA